LILQIPAGEYQLLTRCLPTPYHSDTRWQPHRTDFQSIYNAQYISVSFLIINVNKIIKPKTVPNLHLCDFQITEDLLTEIPIFKDILKVSRESRREFGSVYYDTIEELDFLKRRLVDLQSDNNIGSHLFDIENVENRITELMMETTKFQH